MKNKAIIDRFFPQGLSGKRIIEIGVGGEGGLLLQLMRNNEVHGMDVSDSAINNCQRFGITVTKSNLDCDAMPFPADYFDIVFAFEVFEHLANPQHALEEIRRVLSPGGIFISSIPATCTHHWPRLFYAGLFELDNFKEFLMINEFRVTCIQDWIHQNCYRRYPVSPDLKSWSWYCYAEKLGPKDAQDYFELGRCFWEKRNEFGIRTRPVEAIDLFRKAHRISPDDTRMRLALTHSLIYRAISGDREEFLPLLTEIVNSLSGPQNHNDKVESLSRLLLIDIEASRLGFNILNPGDYANLKEQLCHLPEARGVLEEISREAEINRKLSMGISL